METETVIASSDEALKELKGAFVTSLIRSNKTIKSDRALAIAEGTEMFYKRKVEDMSVLLKQLRRERDNLIDALSPGDKVTLKLATDFNPEDFVSKDLDLGVKIRDLEIKLEIALKQYKHLFN